MVASSDPNTDVEEISHLERDSAQLNSMLTSVTDENNRMVAQINAMRTFLFCISQQRDADQSDNSGSRVDRICN